jgi:hypothetical protein
MEIDTQFPTKLETISDAPEPLRGALVDGLLSGEPVRLLVHSPAFLVGAEKLPATVLAVTKNGWLLASETEDGGATLQKSDFGDILFLDLKSILLSGWLRISFAAVDALSSATVRFETVWDEFYHEAIELMLAGSDPALPAAAETGRNEASTFEAWPMKFRNEAQRYWPKGQPLLAAVQWPAMVDELQGQIAPAGALLITGRELVLILDEKESSAKDSSTEEPKERRTEQVAPPQSEASTETLLVPVAEDADIDSDQLPGDVYEFGENILFVPRVRLRGFDVSHREHFAVLTLEIHAAHGGEKLEVVFPSDHEKDVLKAMKQVSLSP